MKKRAQRQSRTRHRLHQRAIARALAKQFVTVEQFAAYIIFLCSLAGDQVTGTALPLDGGWTAQ